MSREDDDPVKAAFDGDEDLYDVATWEVRSALDSAAVAVWEGVQRAGRWASSSSPSRCSPPNSPSSAW